MGIYFTHPYSSWERGTSENHNGIIRRWIPKGTSIEGYSRSYIQSVEDKMNHLPRRIHGFKTPHELFKEIEFEMYRSTVHQWERDQYMKMY